MGWKIANDRFITHVKRSLYFASCSQVNRKTNKVLAKKNRANTKKTKPDDMIRENDFVQRKMIRKFFFSFSFFTLGLQNAFKLFQKQSNKIKAPSTILTSLLPTNS